MAKGVIYSPLFSYPLQLGILINASDSSIISNVYSEYSLNGKTYDSIIEVHHFMNVDSNNLEFTNINDCFFCSTTIGLIKIRLYHPYDHINHVWELTKSRIIK